jgi:serine/threonine protein kinase
MPSLGTRAYWSPERFRTGHPVTDAADLYAVGVILYIMLVGVHPFDTTGLASDVEIERLIRTSSTPPMSLASHLSPSARDFIKCLMERDPAKRLTSIAALEVG